MIDSKIFVEKLVEEGYGSVCVVPCSFAKNLINALISNLNIEYIPCASEAVACSIAAGLKMAGKKPVVVVQSSGLTNMGSTITSLLNPYNILFPIIVSWRTYKEGDSEVQHQHLATKLPNLIEAYGYGYNILEQNNISKTMEQLAEANKVAKMLILKKDTFDKVELPEKHKIDILAYPRRGQYLSHLNEKFKESDTLFIGTTGNTSREMYSFMPDTNNFYMVGNMGGALSLGLGAALAGKRVIVCGGDAEFVMHLGGLTTAGRYKEKVDLTYILFDNESNKSTGGQATYQSHVDYIGIAKSANINIVDATISNLDEFAISLNTVERLYGIKFMHIKCSFDLEVPRPPVEAVKIKEFV